MDYLEFKDHKVSPDQFFSYLDSIKNSNTPIVIENGSYNCRVGWATVEKPLMVFKNCLAKPRKERGKKDGEMQVGNDIVNIEAVRFQLKTQFDRNIVTHCEIQEHIFNYMFSHLGINTETVNHPIIITEAFMNPNYSRSCMSELLFECYGVPSICYAVDSVLSYRNESKNGNTGLIISCGYYSTHVIPIIDGAIDAKHSRRLDIGGYHITSYLHRLLQLKYPVHFAAITLSRTEELLHEHCHVAVDYLEELRKWSDGDYYDQNIKCFQLPYTSQSSLTPEQQKERRRELARRLIEINARKREEKLAEDEEQLNQLLAIQDLQDEGEETEFQKAVSDFGLNSCEDLPKMIGQIQARIEKTRQKIVAANTSEDPITEEPKQKIMKFQTPKGEEDFKSWVEGVRRKREEILEKRAIRRQRRSDMAKRKTAASFERMRLISQLARNEKRDDDFGLRDEDWDVYKAINKEGGDTDSEGETEKLLELEQVLKAHDPSFWSEGIEAPGETHRLHVGVERFRAPELLFQPSMFGCHQAGLAEVIEYVLNGYDEDMANKLSKEVFITGGLANLSGLKDRIIAELTQIRPFRSKIAVQVANSPSLSAWYKARDMARNLSWLKSSSITKEDFLEKGYEYLKEHCVSNPYTSSPAPITQIEGAVHNAPSIVSEEIEIDVI
ncbi:unnamed protein product [Nezara viridula]|uniref:Actin-related protein 5 n=1 Tax=Nezara viridula TaxID=85310 RepID=A0A9P0HRG5_NEZVI|nr:unnamed protein product [Nezara viridula]